jgi:hypothetical protein
LHRAREAQRERNDDLGAPQRLHSRSRKREKRGAGEGGERRTSVTRGTGGEQTARRQITQDRIRGRRHVSGIAAPVSPAPPPPPPPPPPRLSPQSAEMRAPARPPASVNVIFPPPSGKMFSSRLAAGTERSTAPPPPSRSADKSLLLPELAEARDERAGAAGAGEMRR